MQAVDLFVLSPAGLIVFFRNTMQQLMHESTICNRSVNQGDLMGWLRRKGSMPVEREDRATQSAIETYENNKLVALNYIGDGDYELRVVGLSFHETGVSALLDAVDEIDDGMAGFTAQLIREPYNPHDQNAIRVDILGRTVGYVPREVAEVMASKLDIRGKNMDIACPALIRWNPSYMDVSSILLDIEYDAQAKTKREEIDRLAAASDEAARKAVSDGHIIELWGSGGRPRGEVMGESMYAKHIRQVILEKSGQSSLGTDGMEIEVDAILVSTDGDMRVLVSGGQVGYLPIEVREVLESALKEVAAKGCVAQVRARLWANESIASATIDVGDSETLLPVNGLPITKHAIIPSGKTVQVTGEEEYLDALVRLLSGASQRSVWVTLHEVSMASGKTEKRIVEARVNDEVVGQFTAGMSTEFLPAIRLLAQHDRIAVARGLVKGNRLKVEVTVKAAKSGEIPADWFEVLG